MPLFPSPSTKAALRVMVLFAVKVPLAVVLDTTIKSPVMVVVPLTARLEFKVVSVAVTLKSVVMLVTFVPSDWSPKFSTHALPFQRKVVLVSVPATGA